MQISVVLAAAVAAWLAAGAAGAATIGFVATAACTANCAAARLAAGEVVKARMTVDDTSFTPGGFLQDSDLIGFNVRFGGTTLSSGNAFGSSFFAEWGASSREITTFSLQAASNEAPTTGPAFGISDLFPSAFTRDGFCQNATCGVVEVGNAATGTAATISAVPLPPALLLSLSAIVGLVASARRKGQGSERG